MDSSSRPTAGRAVPASEPLTPVLSPKSENPVRWLHTAVAALLLVLTFWGFKDFYLRGLAYPAHPMEPSVRPLLVAHGVVMTCWLFLALVQPFLIATGNRKLHMNLGMFGTALAILVTVIGLAVPIFGTRVGPDMILWGLHRINFTAIPILSILIFGVFVAVGVANRRRPAIHRSCMLLATLAALAASTSRIAAIPPLYAATVFGTVFGPFFPALLIGLGYLLIKWALTRTFDRPFAIGFTLLVLGCILIMRVAPTHAWQQFALSLVGVQPK